MTERGALAGLLVLELGDRIAAGVAGSLLTQAGADVVVVEPSALAADKWAHRALVTAGKLSIPGGASVDGKLLCDLLAQVDVVIASDRDPRALKNLMAAPSAGQVVCEISAFGSSGPLAGAADSDFLVQSAGGVMDVSGLPSEPPTPVGLPVIEVMAGIYAASAIAAALRLRDHGGEGQAIEVSLYDCAVNAQATFLPFQFAGRTPKRAGNRHSMCAPWNCYRAQDCWVLLCSATNDQWLRLCEVMERPDLAARKDLETLADRLAKCDEVDAEVQRWVGGRTFAECIEKLGRAGLACGPIVPVAALEDEPNLAHRQFVRSLADPVSGQAVKFPASPFHCTPVIGMTPARIPAPGADLAAVKVKLAARRTAPPSGKPLAAPLADIRVLEIGQYTTAPLAARHLATLGAEVFKIEPPQGESSRFWPPHKNGQGYFFTLSNSDKESVMLDLATETGRADFEALLKKADVFVENTKPGSLERRGFGPRDLARINPRLIYCAISGFGYTSAYPRRPAFDTVIQAMSGVMDITRSAGVPVKAGISVADIIGGQFALLAILLALKQRDASGQGCFIDIAMQEACAWSTQFAWNGAGKTDAHAVLRCRDGFVAVEAAESEVLHALGVADAVALPADEVLARLTTAKLAARKAASIAELVVAPQTMARELILERPDPSGQPWPLLGSPMRLAKTPPKITAVIGTLGSGNGRAARLLGRDSAVHNEQKTKECTHV